MASCWQKTCRDCEFKYEGLKECCNKVDQVDVFFAWYLCVAWISMSMAELPFESSAINFDNVKTTH